MTTLGVIGSDGDRRRWFAHALEDYAAALTQFIAKIADTTPVGVDGEPILITHWRALATAKSGRRNIAEFRAATLDALLGDIADIEMERLAGMARDPARGLPRHITRPVLAQIAQAIVLGSLADVEPPGALLRYVDVIRGEAPTVKQNAADLVTEVLLAAEDEISPPLALTLAPWLTHGSNDQRRMLIRAAIALVPDDSAERLVTRLMHLGALFPETTAVYVEEILQRKPAQLVSMIEAAVLANANGAPIRSLLITATANARITTADGDRLDPLLDHPPWRLLVYLRRVVLQRLRHLTPRTGWISWRRLGGYA